jgi:glycosyltransferase involved in cell wall biosynthesis
MDEDPLISIIFPVFNASQYLDAAFESICLQTYRNIEVSILDDGSQDNSVEVIEKWIPRLKAQGFSVAFTTSEIQTTKATHERFPEGHGCGVAKNRSVHASKGQFLCFQDADDTMMPQRLAFCN